MLLIPAARSSQEVSKHLVKTCEHQRNPSAVRANINNLCLKGKSLRFSPRTGDHRPNRPITLKENTLWIGPLVYLSFQEVPLSGHSFSKLRSPKASKLFIESVSNRSFIWRCQTARQTGAALRRDLSGRGGSWGHRARYGPGCAVVSGSFVSSGQWTVWRAWTW